MSDFENKWFLRYRELESTLEQVIRRAAEIKTGAQNETSQFKLRKVVRSEFGGRKFLVCIADGANMEYSFEFLKEKRSLETKAFQRLNSIELTNQIVKSADSCVVRVKSNVPENKGQILTAKVTI